MIRLAAMRKRVTKKLTPPRRRRDKRKPDTESERFVRDLVVTGQAAKLTKDGRVPKSATHVVEQENPTKVRRVRFHLF